MRTLLFVGALTGCADVTPIVDGESFGSVTVVQDWFTSVALIRTGDGPVLVDAGFRPSAVEAGLEAQDVDPKTVSTVLLTHGHGDHVAGRSALPNAALWGIGSEAALLAEENDGVTLDRSLLAGERLTFGDTEIEVLSVPGHTPGSAVFLVDGVLLLGDTCLVDGDGVVVPAPVKHSEDPEQAERSLATLARQLDARGARVDWLVPSHSGAAKGLGPLLEFADRVEAAQHP